MRIMLVLTLLLASILACSGPVPDMETSNTISTTEFDDKATTPDGWVILAPGMTYREERVEPSTGLPFIMKVIRFDPSLVQFRVHYSREPRRSLEWQNELSDALAIINGNFFNEQNFPLGLVIADGNFIGQSFVGFGGMFQIDTNGYPRVRSLVQEAYYGDTLWQATQGFPMLIEPGGIAASTGDGFDNRARRTAIAQDFNGHIYFISTGSFGEISLRDLQTWLLQREYGLYAAFGLDGGKSTMLILRPSEGDIMFQPSISELPVVIGVYSR